MAWLSSGNWRLERIEALFLFGGAMISYYVCLGSLSIGLLIGIGLLIHTLGDGLDRDS